MLFILHRVLELQYFLSVNKFCYPNSCQGLFTNYVDKRSVKCSQCSRATAKGKWAKMPRFCEIECGCGSNSSGIALLPAKNLPWRPCSLAILKLVAVAELCSCWLVLYKFSENSVSDLNLELSYFTVWWCSNAYFSHFG